MESDLVVHGYFNFDSGRAAGEHFVQMRAMPTAVFASNDEMAAGVLQVAHERGVAIPRQMSIVGFDDTPVSREVWPAMTTVHQPIKSEEHPSELQSLMRISYAVLCLKKKYIKMITSLTSTNQIYNNGT